MLHFETLTHPAPDETRQNPTLSRPTLSPRSAQVHDRVSGCVCDAFEFLVSGLRIETMDLRLGTDLAGSWFSQARGAAESQS